MDTIMMYITTQKRRNTDCMYRLHKSNTTQKVGITHTATQPSAWAIYARASWKLGAGTCARERAGS